MLDRIMRCGNAIRSETMGNACRRKVLYDASEFVNCATHLLTIDAKPGTLEAI
jgi:hypothetical protein